MFASRLSSGSQDVSSLQKASSPDISKTDDSEKLLKGAYDRGIEMVILVAEDDLEWRSC